MQEAPTSSDRFLLKALGEAAGELQNLLWSASEGQSRESASPPDEGWCLLAIGVHLAEVERSTNLQFETILRRPNAPIHHVDLDDIPFPEDYAYMTINEAISGFAHARQETAYSLWGLTHEQWERTALHPYRGKVALIDLVRDLYKHDLEHLWQARRMLGLDPVARR
ncbi:MAG TPA: hypothetical protein DGL25_01080 [Dehalococcoidia bacterium]|nr:hypothetical protein [Dehalococcoidia bacterium]